VDLTSSRSEPRRSAFPTNAQPPESRRRPLGSLAVRSVPLIAALALLAPPAALAKSTTEKIGDAGQIALPAAGLVAAALHKDGKGALQLAEAFGSTMIVVYVLKVSIDRTRPNGGGQSFPSGHTASAFSGAAFLQLRYGWAYGVPAYLAAAFVGYSRVESKQHWTSDVLAGGALGIAGNLVFTRRYHNVVVAPVLQPRTVGVAISVTW
jgi:membrane-associated phospholipid phosphatase